MHRRIRTTLTPIGLTLALLGCTSGSEAVPIPGADAVVTAPVASADVPQVIDTTPIDAVAPDETDAPAPTTDAPAATTTPTTTQAPSTSTTAPTPLETTVASPATDTPTEDIFLRLGDEGPEVGVMQLKLSVLEYLPAGSDTGVFDEETQRGLRLFQSDYGLGVDGIFGPLTGRSLNAAVQSVAVET